VQASVEAFEDFGIELDGLQLTQSGDDVEADEVLVPLAGGHLEVGDL
jgi:hypothetical protein